MPSPFYDPYEFDFDFDFGDYDQFDPYQDSGSFDLGTAEPTAPAPPPAPSVPAPPSTQTAPSYPDFSVDPYQDSDPFGGQFEFAPFEPPPPPTGFPPHILGRAPQEGDPGTITKDGTTVKIPQPQPRPGIDMGMEDFRRRQAGGEDTFEGRLPQVVGDLPPDMTLEEYREAFPVDPKTGFRPSPPLARVALPPGVDARFAQPAPTPAPTPAAPPPPLDMAKLMEELARAAPAPRDLGPTPTAPGGLTQLPDSPFPLLLEQALGRLTQGEGSTQFGQDLQQQLAGIIERGGGLEGGPDPSDPSGDRADRALEQLVSGQGSTEFGQELQQRILGTLGRGGRFDDETEALEFENARTMIDRARRAQSNEARAALAGRGSVSVPGIEQGGTRSTVGRIEEGLAPFFSQAMRDIEIDRGRRADQRYSQALQAGSGLAQAAAPSLLGAGTAAAQRQQREGERRDVRLRQAIQSGSTLAQGAASTLLGAGQTSLQQQEFVTRAALDNLNQNRQWNQFLAQHGLDRERLMFEMEQGNIEVILPIIQQFIQASGIAAGGFF